MALFNPGVVVAGGLLIAPGRYYNADAAREILAIESNIADSQMPGIEHYAEAGGLNISDSKTNYLGDLTR